MMKEENHMFQGLKRDNHQIKQEGKYLWDAHNIRLTNRDDSTLLSITNERGTLDTGVSFEGSYVGHCVIGKYLVLFTYKENIIEENGEITDNSENYIYRIEKTDNAFKTIILFYYKGKWEKRWTTKYPIEALGYYETSLVQKVYWVDGVNQPRLINITRPEYLLANTKYNLVFEASGWDFSGKAPSSDGRTFNYKIPAPNGISWEEWERDFIEDYEEVYKDGIYLKSSFDFTRELELNDIVTVSKIYGEGEFSAGTIQYAISYYNKYEQESNISYVTPLYYISPRDRGASPEEKVACSFNINILNPDLNFEYIRLYSIHRTSIDLEPTVKIVTDLELASTDNFKLSYIDTGTTGSTIDPKQLLYIGGEAIIANCITEKDNTLFLGGIALKNDNLLEIKNIINYFELDDHIIKYSGSTLNSENSYYYNYPNLTTQYEAGFATGETYRLGVQVQYSNGKWSTPIFIGDSILCDEYPWTSYPLRLSKRLHILNNPDDIYISTKLRNLGVRRIRACIVFPRVSERENICQGILCPTVFNVQDRKSNSVYARSSWFFRPAVDMSHNTEDSNVYKGAFIQYSHNKALFTGENRGAEIQNMLPGALSLNDVTNPDDYSSHFFVDENIVTFHSPDIEFDTSLSNMSWDNVKLVISGIAKLGAISGDIDIETSSPFIGSYSKGFIHERLGYQTLEDRYQNGGLVMGLFYDDSIVKTDYTGKTDRRSYAVYPWHRSGSLNNDSKRPEEKGTRSAVLSKKVISNLKFFDRNTSLGGDSPIVLNISTPQLFSSEELQAIKLHPSYLGKDVIYMGNTDSLISSSSEYPIYISSTGFTGSITKINYEDTIKVSNDPVRIKYKSTPHLVFSLGDSTSTVQILPRHAAIGKTAEDTYTPPDWDNIGNDPSQHIKYDGIISCITDYIGHIYRLQPKDDQLGMYLLFYSKNPKDDPDNKYVRVFQAFTGTVGNSWREITGNTETTLLAKFGVTYTYSKSRFPPNTTSENYNNYIYTGTDRYYKLNWSSADKCYILDDVTESITTSNLSIQNLNTSIKINQQVFGDQSDRDGEFPYLLIGTLIRTSIDNKFGGTSDIDLQQNLWVPAGPPVNITDDMQDEDIYVPFEYGDTWYSRYDCLKTCPFTREDENQIVEIGSFMLETRINLDGRYDKNRGQYSNINITPQNFNKLNDIYSQKDNFFNYRILDNDYYKQSVFNNQVTWSLEKSTGEDIDSWAHITLSNTLDMDGSKGKVTALKAWNEYLMCFQEKALSQILFNNRAQIAVSDGVPIEISNGGKVDGSRLFSGVVGCNDKWKLVDTPMGLYFIDSNTDSIYLFNGQLSNLSTVNGMNWWVKQSKTNSLWKPTSHNNTVNGIRAFVDNRHGDIYFTPGPIAGATQSDALCYSEHLQTFTSLMSYGGVPAMFNYNDGFYSLKESNGNLKLYQNNMGNYNDFYGEYKGWDFSFISNENPTYTKIFDTIELRADHYDTESTLLNDFPMSYIKVSNEYQNGEETINNRNMRKKFRVWRGFIPRNHGTMQRIRNPWVEITLGWKPKSLNEIAKEMPENSTDQEIEEATLRYNTKRAVVHDLTVKYTI